jgi:hypothetical protein
MSAVEQYEHGSAEALRELNAAFAKAQGEFPAISKDKTATIETRSGGSYSYNYADLADIIAAVRKPLADNALSFTQPLDITTSGQLVLRTELRHAAGGIIGSTFPMQEAGDWKAFGAAHTYLRRYALTGLLGIATEDDTDASGAEKPPAAESSGVAGGFTSGPKPSYEPEPGYEPSQGPAPKVVTEVKQYENEILPSLQKQLGEELTDWAAWSFDKHGGRPQTDKGYRTVLADYVEEAERRIAQLANQVTRTGEWPGEGREGNG